jgi:hypothetical protein
MKPGSSQDYYAQVYETQGIINRSLLSANEFEKLTEEEKKEAIQTITTIRSLAFSLARLVIAAQERNKTFDSKDHFNLKTIVGE